jgi:hypothetical protein
MCGIPHAPIISARRNFKGYIVNYYDVKKEEDKKERKNNKQVMHVKQEY